jgi:hypothetical protein
MQAGSITVVVGSHFATGGRVTMLSLMTWVNAQMIIPLIGLITMATMSHPIANGPPLESNSTISEEADLLSSMVKSRPYRIGPMSLALDLTHFIKDLKGSQSKKHLLLEA